MRSVPCIYKKMFCVTMVSIIAVWHTCVFGNIDTREYADWSNYPQIVLFNGDVDERHLCTATCISDNSIILTDYMCFFDGEEHIVPTGVIIDYKNQTANVELVKTCLGETFDDIDWAIYALKDSDICQDNYIEIGDTDIKDIKEDEHVFDDVTIASFDTSKILSDNEMRTIEQLVKQVIKEINEASEYDREQLVERFTDRLGELYKEHGITFTEEVEVTLNGYDYRRGNLKIHKNCDITVSTDSVYDYWDNWATCDIDTFKISSPVLQNNKLLGLVMDAGLFDYIAYYHDTKNEYDYVGVHVSGHVFPSKYFKQSIIELNTHNTESQDGSSGSVNIDQAPSISGLLDKVSPQLSTVINSGNISQTDKKQLAEELEQAEEVIASQMQKVDNMNDQEMFYFVQQIQSYSELQKAYEEAKAREQSLANRMLGGATMALTGIGGMELAQGLAEQRADKDAEMDMTAYMETFRCEYGNGKSVKGGVSEIQLPSNNLFDLYQEYITLSDDLKERKEALGLKPGIESEVILNKANTGLYDDESSGITNGAYASLYRAKMGNETDKTKINEDNESSQKRATIGGMLGGGGVVGGIVGNSLINGKEDKK